ncbi:MAG: DUF4440 domain-containing protein [Burkholderiaceae bacterium]|nr:DUF4440 domain-containing protein [Burkholderiaceae bacterium]
MGADPQASAALSDSDRAQLTQLEESLWRAATRFDLGFMEKTLSPDFFEFGRSGRVWSHEQILDMAGRTIDATLPLPNLSVRLLDADTAHLTYDSAVVSDGVVEHAHRSSIWSRTASGWMLRFHQGTPFRLAPHALMRWHELVRSRDLRGLAELLADDVVFHSPVVHTPQAGKAVTTQYLAAALRVFFNDSFRYVREVAGERDAVLEFEVDIDGIQVNGVDMIAWNAEGRITSFKVMIRPLKAINLIHQKMAAMLQARS